MHPVEPHSGRGAKLGHPVPLDSAPPLCGAKRTAQTALPRPARGLHPHTSLSTSTICRPRPDCAAPSGALSTGIVSLGSSTAQITSPARRRRRRRRFSWPGLPSLADRAPCVMAFATSSPTMISASSASDGRPQSCNVSRVRRRAAAADRGYRVSGQPATGGASHQLADVLRTRGRTDLWSDWAGKLCGWPVAGPLPGRGSDRACW
jgi:hypothetical protein